MKILVFCHTIAERERHYERLKQTKNNYTSAETSLEAPCQQEFHSTSPQKIGNKKNINLAHLTIGKLRCILTTQSFSVEKL